MGNRGGPENATDLRRASRFMTMAGTFRAGLDTCCRAPKHASRDNSLVSGRNRGEGNGQHWRVSAWA
jgi:hypothetical protein